jgi:hypothetical protein
LVGKAEALVDLAANARNDDAGGGALVIDRVVEKLELLGDRLREVLGQRLKV